MALNEFNDPKVNKVTTIKEMDGLGKGIQIGTKKKSKTSATQNKGNQTNKQTKQSYITDR